MRHDYDYAVITMVDITKTNEFRKSGKQRNPEADVSALGGGKKPKTDRL